MYYDNKNKKIVNKLPKNSIGPDGNFVFNFDTLNDINLYSDHEYYVIRNDNLSPGDDYVEQEDQRVVTLEKPYADIVRTWTKISVPEINIPTTIPTPNIHNNIIDEA
ncbi:hypothetical protein EBZ38_14020 [bacterium]|nr:hypothetical protein [bacterium]NDC95758.1 hypothetical protein [bacterium]NDD85374.1 hypothetical protein [bacterium]